MLLRKILRKILSKICAGVAVAALIPAALVSAPANAAGFFDFQDNTPNNGFYENLYGCLILSQGTGNEFTGKGGAVCNNSPHTDFALTNERTINGIKTYEIEVPTGTVGCMQVGSDTGVYYNSCVAGRSTEEWIQTIVSDGQHWENVHYGTYLSVNCGLTQCAGQVVATSSPISWATPSS